MRYLFLRIDRTANSTAAKTAAHIRLFQLLLVISGGLMADPVLSSSRPNSKPLDSVSVAAPVITRLHHDGRFLVDGNNRVVLLHGVNAVWKLKPYSPPDSDEGLTDADAAWLVDHGFNAVRLGVLFVGVMPEPGVIDTSYLDAIDRSVQLLTARGIWVLLDFHQDMYNEKYHGEGFPDWAVDDDHLPAQTDIGFPGNYFLPATSRAFDHFWADSIGLWSHYQTAWTAVAARWHAQPYLLGYDLMNEPWPGSNYALCLPPAGCPRFDAVKLQAMQQQALAGIRSQDPDTLTWFEPLVFISYAAKTWLGEFTPVNDAQLGLSWHLYCPLDSTAGNVACKGLDYGVVDQAEAGAAQLNAASLNTEFGATDASSELTRSTALFDRRLLGWMYWAYKNWNDPTTSAGSNAQGMFTDDADLSTVKLAKLQLLERTYPRATAGTPQYLSFDPTTGDFSYRYTPRSGSTQTEIYVPVALHYPHGYKVIVRGAQIASASNATLLLLNTLPGATEVTLEIKAL